MHMLLNKTEEIKFNQQKYIEMKQVEYIYLLWESEAVQ